MKRTKRERIPSARREMRNREIRVLDWWENLPTFYPDGQPWITDLGINGRNK